MKFINCLDSKTLVFCLAKLSYPTQLEKQSIIRVLKVINTSASDAWEWWHIVVSNAETASSFADMQRQLFGLEAKFIEREKFDEVGGKFNSWEEAEISLDLYGWHLVEDVANFFSEKRIYLPLETVEKIWMIDKDKTCLIDG